MIDLKKTGEFIAACRKKNNLTQKQLAEKLNVTDKAVSKWETGKSFPDVNILEDLCGILEIRVSDLLAGKRIETEHYPEETEKMLVMAVSDGQLYGFQLIFYLIQLVAVILFYMPFLNIRLFSEGVLPENILCWAACAILMGCAAWLDRKIPGKAFRSSNAVIEGLAGGMFFAVVVGFTLIRSGGAEEASVQDRILVGTVICLCLVLSVTARAAFAKIRRHHMGENGESS